MYITERDKGAYNTTNFNSTVSFTTVYVQGLNGTNSLQGLARVAHIYIYMHTHIYMCNPCKGCVSYIYIYEKHIPCTNSFLLPNTHYSMLAHYCYTNVPENHVFAASCIWSYSPGNCDSTAVTRESSLC